MNDIIGRKKETIEEFGIFAATAAGDYGLDYVRRYDRTRQKSGIILDFGEVKINLYDKPESTLDKRRFTIMVEIDCEVSPLALRCIEKFVADIEEHLAWVELTPYVNQTNKEIK